MKSADASRYNIVMFAHNEAENLVRSLPAVHGNCDEELHEFHLIANGCSDATVAEAQRIKQEMKFSEMHITDLSLGDKCNAWNHYVHHIADPGIPCHFFIDADVHFSPLCFPRLANRLITAHPPANIVAGMPLSGRNVDFHRMLVRERACFFGNLYGMHSNYLELLRRRNFHLPVGLCWIDSFLTKAANTDLTFTPENLPGRVVYEDGVGFAFESLSHFRWSDIRLYRNRIARYELGKLQEYYLDSLEVTDWPATMDAINADIWKNFRKVATSIGPFKRFLVRQRLRRLLASQVTTGQRGP